MSSGVGGTFGAGSAYPTGATQSVAGAKTQQLRTIRSVRDSISKAPSSSQPSENPENPQMKRPVRDTPFPQELQKWQGSRKAYKENPAANELEKLKQGASNAMEALARGMNDLKVGVISEKSFERGKAKYLEYKTTWERKWSETAIAFNNHCANTSERVDDSVKLPTPEQFKPAGQGGFFFKPNIAALIPVQTSRYEGANPK